MELPETGSEQLQALAEQFDAETIQLLYQIALHGKRDLNWAADPKSGFDMTLLRMLSFQPSSPPAVEDTPLKKSPSPRKPAVTSPPVQSDVSVEITKPQPPEAVNPTPAVMEPAAPTAPSEQQEQPAPAAVSAIDTAPLVTDNTLISVDLSPANWTQIIAELKLSALTRQLAENSALIRCEQDAVHLALSPELGHLATDKSKQRLTSALTERLGQDLKLVFADADANIETGPTLAVERAEQAAERQQQAVDAIHNDPTVEIIKNTFNARIIEQSIKPID
jgi:DNA polymerase-3 subunit gamma/tau